MKRLVVAACATACLGLLVGPAAAPAQKNGKGKARTIVFDVLVREADVTAVDANPDGTAGDYVVGTVDVFRPGTRDKIGTASFKSLEADRGFQLFSAAVRLKQGDIFLEGLTSNTDGPVVFDAIVGGTRAFAGARGEARERSLGEGDDTSEASNLIRVTLKFTTENARTKKKR